MSTRLDETIATMGADNLISDVYPPADVFSVKILKESGTATTYKRGTVLALGEDGKMVILGTAGTAGTFSSTGDGSTKAFSLIANGVKPATVTEVKVDGTALETGFEYNAETGYLIFAEAPANTKTIAVKTTIGAYTANAILAEDVTVGTAADAAAIAYRTGHFNSNALIVASGYTITAADKEALRTAGILLSDAVSIASN